MPYDIQAYSIPYVAEKLELLVDERSEKHDWLFDNHATTFLTPFLDLL